MVIGALDDAEHVIGALLNDRRDFVNCFNLGQKCAGGQASVEEGPGPLPQEPLSKAVAVRTPIAPGMQTVALGWSPQT